MSPSLAKLLAEVTALINASTSYCTNKEADRARLQEGRR